MADTETMKALKRATREVSRLERNIADWKDSPNAELRLACKTYAEELAFWTEVKQALTIIAQAQAGKGGES